MNPLFGRVPATQSRTIPVTGKLVQVLVNAELYVAVPARSPTAALIEFQVTVDGAQFWVTARASNATELALEVLSSTLLSQYSDNSATSTGVPAGTIPARLNCIRLRILPHRSTPTPSRGSVP